MKLKVLFYFYVNATFLEIKVCQEKNIFSYLQKNVSRNKKFLRH
jgi:hypothetical protein